MGSGDLLFLNPEESGLQRAQSVLVDDREIENLITYWQNKSSNVEEERIAPWEDIVPIMNGDSDELVYKAADLVRSEGKASTSWLQRKLRIGFPRAARLMEELEDMGVVGPLEPGSREREILDFPGGENEVDNN
jgi:S-DNA-T family DNA segregation ATPase FtsK/SpoIIIE